MRKWRSIRSGRLSCGADRDILRQSLHFGDQSLNGFAAPHLQASPQRTQMVAAIESRIARLEFGEEFDGCLIRPRLQTLKHLRPVSDETLGTRTASARLIAEAAVFGSPDHDAPSTRILTPYVSRA